MRRRRQLFISIYNDQGRAEPHLEAGQKGLCHDASRPQVAGACAGICAAVGADFVRDALNGAHCALAGLRQGRPGMHPWRDVVDWVGGYPFEVAKPEEIFEFFRARGFELRRLKTCAGGKGCNEFVFVRSGAANSRTPAVTEYRSDSGAHPTTVPFDLSGHPCTQPRWIGAATCRACPRASAARTSGERRVFYSPAPLEAELSQAGVAVIDLRKIGRWDNLGFLRRLRAAIRNANPDVVYSFLGGANIFAAAVRPFIPVPSSSGAYRSADMDLTRYDWAHRFAFAIERRLSRAADLIIANSWAGPGIRRGPRFPARANCRGSQWDRCFTVPARRRD